MPGVRLSSTQVYLVSDGSPLTIDIIIGDGQPGGTSLLWENQTIEIPPNQPPVLLAPDGGTTRTKTLHCVTRVRDQRPDTNNTSVTYVLRGGLEDREFVFALMVPNEQDFADYVVDFLFI